MAETEAILLRRFARGHDAAAFAEITRRHAGLVYGAAWRILSDMDRAADVAQETFLQLAKDAGTITGSLPGWLHRVATHKAIDARRREINRKHREVQYAENQEQETGDWKDISPCVDEALRGLDPELRDVLIAHFLDGQTTRGIADARGISQATVSRRIEAGVHQLRTILRKRGVIVAVASLALLLTQNSAQAAPAALMAELGKMALVGGGSAAAAGSASSMLAHMLGTIAAAVKANAVAFAAIAVIGVSSVVTYDFVATSKKTNAPVPPPTTQTTVRTAVASAPVGRLPADTVPPPTPRAVPMSQAESGGFTAGGAGGRIAVANSSEPTSDEAAKYREAAKKPKTDPNDSNDRRKKDPNDRRDPNDGGTSASQP
jgi:RNA polymerase sigma factor (sigma-70 family)